MSESFGFGIIGAGVISEYHARAIEAQSDGKIVAPFIEAEDVVAAYNPNNPPFALGFDDRHFADRSLSSCSVKRKSRLRFGIFTLIRSPFCIRAIGPPSIASGQT